MKVANPDYVVGKKPPYAMQPPITHPPFCVCAICPGHRQRKAEETGRTMDEVWSELLVIRARRASPDPSSYRATAAAVQDLLVDEPLRLAAAVKAAEEAKLAKQSMTKTTRSSTVGSCRRSFRPPSRSSCNPAPI